MLQGLNGSAIWPTYFGPRTILSQKYFCNKSRNKLCIVCMRVYVVLFFLTIVVRKVKAHISCCYTNFICWPRVYHLLEHIVHVYH